jgi:hypothetical protein
MNAVALQLRLQVADQLARVHQCPEACRVTQYLRVERIREDTNAVFTTDTRCAAVAARVIRLFRCIPLQSIKRFRREGLVRTAGRRV